MARVLLLASLAESLQNFRGDLIRRLIAHGHEVIAAAPGEAPDVDRWLGALGVRRLKIGLDRTGSNLWTDVRLLLELRRLMCAEKPDVLLAYTIKPVIYGSVAARLAGVPRRAAMITGLGFAFAPSSSLPQWAVRSVARALYRIAMACSDTIFFQNPDDEADFRSAGLLCRGQRIVHTCGSGVNLEHFAATPLPQAPLRFLMIARLLVDKGVREYLQAAALIRQTRPELSFHLVGPFDEHPSAVSRAELDAAVAAGTVVYHGSVCDVRPYMADCHVYVLPSYREGTPRSVLEAMAVGRPVITTDAPGCRETVVEGDNGFLVPVKSVDALVKAMEHFIDEPDLVARMGRRSRQIAEEKYDVHQVNAVMLRGMGLD